MVSVIRGDDAFDSSSVGSSTDYGAVGTYAYGRPLSSTAYVAGNTAAGFNPIAAVNFNYVPSYHTSSGTYSVYSSSNTLGGTWRAMGASPNLSGRYPSTVWVRIS